MRPLGIPSGLGCRLGPSVVAVRTHEAALGGRRLAVPVDRWWRGSIGACGVRMLVGVYAVPVVLVRAVSVSCAVDGSQGGGCSGPASGGWPLAGSHGWCNRRRYVSS